MPIETPSIGWRGAPGAPVDSPGIESPSSASRAIEAERLGSATLEAVEHAHDSASTGAPEAIHGADRLISASLAAGELDTHGARACLIDDALARAGGARLSATDVHELTAQLDELLAEDPVLARLLA